MEMLERMVATWEGGGKEIDQCGLTENVVKSFLESQVDKAQSVDRLPGLTLWGSSMIDPSFEPHQCLLTST